MVMSGMPTRELVVRRIGVLSAGKVYGAISAAFGLLIGIFFALASMVGAGLGIADADAAAGGAIVGAFFGIGALVFLPLLYGVMGFVGGMLGAVLYNVFAGMVGGVSVELEG